MADSLFLFDRDGEMMVHPDALKMTEHLHKVSKEDFKYIVAAYDYRFSIFHLFPPGEMKIMAKKYAYKENAVNRDPENDELVVAAAKEYRYLNYDENRERKKQFQQKITELTNILLQPGELAVSKLKNIRENISYLESEIEKLERLISKSDSTVVIRGGGELSMIEQWQRRKKRAEEIIGTIEV